MSDSKVLASRFDGVTARAVEMMAERRGEKVSDVIRDAVNDYVRTRGQGDYATAVLEALQLSHHA